MNDKPTYEEAMKEIQDLLDQIKSPDVQLEALEQKVQRAYYLLEYCKQRLRQSEEGLNTLQKAFEQE